MKKTGKGSISFYYTYAEILPQENAELLSGENPYESLQSGTSCVVS